LKKNALELRAWGFTRKCRSDWTFRPSDQGSKTNDRLIIAEKLKTWMNRVQTNIGLA
jgi:hypothetical protein